jgi:hypothetical protein
MPAPIFYQGDQGLLQGILGAGQSIGQGLQQRYANQFQQQQQQAALRQQQEVERQRQAQAMKAQELFGNLPQNFSLSDLTSRIAQGQQAGLTPEMTKPYMDLYQQNLKGREKANESIAFLNRLAPGLVPDEQISMESISGPQGAEIAVQEKTGPQGGISQLDDETLQKLTLSGNPGLTKFAELELNRRKGQKEEFFKEREYHTKQNKKGDEEAFNIERSLPEMELTLKQLESVIESGDIGQFTMANLAERLNIPELTSASGAQAKTLVKNFLIESMGAVGGKGQTQFLEKLLLDSLPKIGQSKEANTAVVEVLRAPLEMKRNFIEERNRIADEDRAKYGYVREGLDSRAIRAAQPRNEEVKEKVGYRVASNRDASIGIEKLKKNWNTKVDPGTYATPTMIRVFIDTFKGDMPKAIENMKKLGYKIPTKEQVKKWR